MRIFSILLALVVAVALYAAVFERDRLLAFSRGEDVDLDGLALPGAEPAEEVAVAVAPQEEAEEADVAAILPEDAPGAVSVVVMRSTAQEIESAVMVRGQTEAIREVEVRAETTGQIISPPLPRGAMVSEGDLLCHLDPGTRQDQLAEAIARLNEARARLPEAEARIPEARARTAEAIAREAEAAGRLAEANARLNEALINDTAARRLGEGGFASETRIANAVAALEGARAGISSAEASVESASAGIAAAEAGIEGALAAVEGVKAQIESAEASVAAARRELDRLDITAPFDGLLETDTAELGELLQTGGLCATVVELDRIRLVGFVPETALSEIRMGAPAAARLATGEEVTGEVTFIGRTADEATRTFRTEIEIPNEDLAIRAGQTVEIVIRAPGGQAHLVPQSALTLNDDGDLGLRLNEDGIAAFYPVSVARDAREGVWVGGLPEVAEIIVTGQEYVGEGTPLDVTYREGAL